MELLVSFCQEFTLEILSEGSRLRELEKSKELSRIYIFVENSDNAITLEEAAWIQNLKLDCRWIIEQVVPLR